VKAAFDPFNANLEKLASGLEEVKGDLQKALTTMDKLVALVKADTK